MNYLPYMPKERNENMGCNILKNEVCHIPKETKKLLVKVDMETNKTVDFICYMVNNYKKVSDTICYQNLLGHGIKMSDTETEIHIELNKIQPNIRCMLFALSIFEPQAELSSLGKKGDFISQENIIFHIYDEDTKKEICHFVPNNKENTTGIYLGNLEKTYSTWNFRAVEESINGDIVGIRNTITNLKHLSQYINRK